MMMYLFKQFRVDELSHRFQPIHHTRTGPADQVIIKGNDFTFLDSGDALPAWRVWQPARALFHRRVTQQDESGFCTTALPG